MKGTTVKKQDVMYVVQIALGVMISVFLMAIYAHPALAASNRPSHQTSPRIEYIVEYKFFSNPPKLIEEALNAEVKPPL